MNDQHQQQLTQRRRKPAKQRTRMPLLILALILTLVTGTLLLEKQQIDAIAGFIKLFDQYSAQDVFATSPSLCQRGNIYDRNYRSLAISYKTFAVYARPLEMDKQNLAVDKLSEVLGLEKNSLLLSLKKERSFVWLARGITQERAEAVMILDLKGVYQVEETKRLYPNQQSAAHVVGFVENGQGLDGIEFQYNSLLRGDEINKKDLNMLTVNAEKGLGKAGAHLVLSIDLMIQSIIERFLKQQMEKAGAAIGTVVLMDANNGAILAMANYPSYDPNRYWEFSTGARKNYAVSEPVYPGELRFIFHQAAALTLKQDIEPAPSGSLAESNPITAISPGKQKKYHLSSAPQVDTVDPEYLDLFSREVGFPRHNSIDIPQPENSFDPASYSLNDPSSGTSALHLLTAFTAAINGGRIVTPHLLNSAYDTKTGVAIGATHNMEKQTALLSPSSSSKLLDFLATKWLKRTGKNNSPDEPLFFESHRMASFDGNVARSAVGNDSADQNPGPTARVTQSVLLGAFPADQPELTMAMVLHYPDSCEDTYPDMLDTADTGSVLAPGRGTVDKILHLANTTPPTPSTDFWDGAGLKVGKNMTPALDKQEPSAQSGHDLITMPDVTGRSLRGGLQVLQHYDLNIKLIGTGWIVSQQPPAGTFLSTKSECILKMGQEI